MGKAYFNLMKEGGGASFPLKKACPNNKIVLHTRYLVNKILNDHYIHHYESSYSSKKTSYLIIALIISV